MPTLYITELSGLGGAENGATPQVAKLPEVTSQSIAIGGSSTPSAAFDPRTRFIRVMSDAGCSIKISDNPTAAVTDVPIASNLPEYFGVTPGHKLAVITRT